jgi:mRNA interferase RelE/StbE
MIYELEFREEALKEWRKLGATIKEEFKSALARRLENPRIPKHALHDMPDHYKIKLRSAGYRLVYRVEDARITVVVIAVGRRERGEVYERARLRNA